MENNNIDNTTTAISWLEKVLELAKKYTFFQWLEAFVVIFIAGTMIVVFTHPKAVVDFFVESAQKEHIELLEQRQKNNAEVQSAIDKFLYKAGADRVVVCELHNGQNSVSGIPFLKATATYESISDSSFPIANQYQNANLSLYPFANYIYDKGYWTGNTEDAGAIDKPLMHRMLANQTKQFSACTIMGEEKTIGFIFVSYINSEPPTDIDIKTEMRKLSVQLGVLLELRNK